MTTITMDMFEFKTLIKQCCEIGAAEYIKKTKPKEDLLSQREAFKMFGETRVRLWERSGLVSSFRAGTSENSKKMFSLTELITAEHSEHCARLNIIRR